ncbi:MAG: hypothetical protein OXF47_00865 [Nitrospira sp.]|nr:hypothetical protein [Nitrospira sp.]
MATGEAHPLKSRLIHHKVDTTIMAVRVRRLRPGRESRCGANAPVTG